MTALVTAAQLYAAFQVTERKKSLNAVHVHGAPRREVSWQERCSLPGLALPVLHQQTVNQVP